ncbi:MAG: hypothetical protein QOI36_4496 [Pseudonocardiales bacterium]|jgi:hypothetical protein|nr:hypothetical protein [Pseudonocardia sp.]MDT7653090.1 hypothetical protein [Pseudonocardiales bacterium]
MSDDLVEFLLARLDEDEQFARLAIAVVQDLAGDDANTTGILDRSAAAGHSARHDPARVLAEVAAKRQLVQRYQLCEAENERNVRLYDEWEAAGGSEFGDGAIAEDPASRRRKTSPLEVEGLWLAIRYLAAADAEHPDYRKEWKP